MKKILALGLSSILVSILLSGCSQSGSEEKQEKSYRWTKESLIKMQIDPVTLRELDFGGAGQKARVLQSSDPELVQGFAATVLPETCLPLSEILNGSSTLGDELVLQTQSETSSLFENAYYQYIRTFPSEEFAIAKMSNLLKVAKNCGVYTRIKSSGESDEGYLWDRIVESTGTSFIAQGEASTYAVGQIGSAIYFQWLIYTSSSNINQNTKVENVSRLKKIIESLLKEEQQLKSP
jgi:hypothetical protein